MPWAWAWFAAPVAAAVLLLLAWRFRPRRRPAAKKAKSEAVFFHVARRSIITSEVDPLVDLDLAERDAKRFYAELSEAVRRSIRQQTGIRLMERTTAEFLRDVGRVPTFSEEGRRRLREFLEAADLVKFAAKQPQRDDIAASVNLARRFLDLQDAEPASEPQEAPA